MRFNSGKGAPDIPRELMEAQENDNLILFCGAGVSYLAGLPLFSGLVSEVYDELATTPTKQEENAIKHWRYDTALELLERRFHSENRADKHLVRKAIATRLTLKGDANLDTHKAILQLAKTKQQKYRLVTTNVDHGFLLADSASLAITDAAPKLPVPKPHKWQSIVYLHGLINKAIDPNSEHLIFTSGDFGTAYLTERWASRFVSELFRHFTVLFVGYSIDDPVIRYMTDAIAADRRRGYTHAKQPYVLAGAKKNKFEQAKDDWEAKGVIPLLYDEKNKHYYLHKCLREWAGYSRDGLDSIVRIIKTHASNLPLSPYEHDFHAQRIVESLKHKNNGDFSAKFFYDAAPPIEWLPILEKEGLLAKAQQTLTHRIGYDLTQPCKTTFILWQWLVEYHLESRQFVEWAIDKREGLHPKLICLIASKMNLKPLQKSYLIFWRCIVNNSHSHFIDVYQELKYLKSNKDYSALSPLLSQLQPIIKFSKAFSWNGEKADKLYEADIVLGMPDRILRELSNQTNEIATWLMPITNALKQTMELWHLLGQADDKQDLSYWHLPSISPHQQNHRHNNWTFLIELSRDLWNSAYQTNKDYAIAILALWKTIPFPVFKRLVFHAYASSDCGSPAEKLNYLLSDNHWWLWSIATKREKFRLLELLSSQLNRDELTILENAITVGVPQEMFREGISDKERQESTEHQIWLHLIKLESFTVTLSKEAKAIFNKLSKKYPQWILKEGEHDEFNYWYSGPSGFDCDLTIDELLALPIDQRIEKLSESSYYIRGRMELCRTICKNKPDFALETLNFLNTHSNWNTSIWYAGLSGLSEANKPFWTEIAGLIVRFPNELFEKEAWVISWWIKTAIGSVEANSEEEQYFWRLFDLLVAHANKSEEIKEDVIFQAINNPIGILTEVFLTRFTVRKFNSNQTITDSNLLSRLNKLVEDKRNTFLLARVILASRLDYLYAVDPEWTRSHLVPLLDWSTSNEAAILWKGYLRGPQISPDLALALKKHLLITLCSHTQELDKATPILFYLFISICFEYKNIFTVNDQQMVLNKIGTVGLIEIARFIQRSLSDDPQKNDQYWKNRIKPLFIKAWPKAAKYLNSQISQAFAEMCMALDNEFEDAVKSIKCILTSFDIQYLLLDLKENPHIKIHPCATFDLLAIVFDTQVEQCWFNNDLKEIINDLAKNCPDIKNDHRYKDIEKLLKRKSNT